MNIRQALLERKKYFLLLLGIVGLWTIYNFNIISSRGQTGIVKANMITFFGKSNDANSKIGKDHGTNGESSHFSLASGKNHDGHLKLRIITWNLQGLLTDKLSERTNSVVSLIQKEMPDVMFFQELINYTYDNLCKSFRKDYGCVRGRTSTQSRYFVGIFYKKNCFRLEDHSIIPFQGSVMDRLLLVVQLYLLGPVKTKIALMTSHLESLPRFSVQRIEQLKESFQIGNSFNQKYNVIFGGDLNLEDGEDTDAVPSNFTDAWIGCGSPESIKYTWDSTQNQNEIGNPFGQSPQTRYDRFYFRPSTPSTIQLVDIDLLGKEKVSGTKYFPSDHWALISTFTISNSTYSKDGKQSHIQCNTV